MITYRLTRRARRDLLDIWNRIADDDEAAADRFLDALRHRFDLLADNPYAGRRRDDLRKAYRSFPVGEYVILYRIAKPGIQILHILHGRRDILSLFRSGLPHTTKRVGLS